MILKLKYPFLLLILSIIFYSCEKEYSLEEGAIGNTSVYSFTGSPGVCVNAVVTGTYEAGIALGATNIVTIAVDVTTLGTYTVSTAAVNGISFSGSGSFTGTGVQTVTLTGTGIPVTAGTFSFTPGTNGCSFPVIVSAGGGSSGTSVFSYSGAPGACTNAVSAGSYTAGSALIASNTVTMDINVTTIGTWSISTAVVNGFSFTGTGSFTSTGAQSITLTGSGTPTTEGSFDFTPPNNGCSFPIVVMPGAVAADFLKCTINGVARTFNVGLSGSNPDPTLFAATGDETTASPSATFQIGVTKTPAVTTGDYNRLSATNTSTYCEIGFNDGVASTPWGTGLLQGNGFTVKVTNYTTNKIEGTFSGSLYSNSGLGSDEKVITSGQFSISY